MPECAIRVENLSKRYRIGRREPVSDTLAGTLLHHLTRPIDNFRRLRKLSAFSENRQAVDDIIWALKDLSFEVPSGTVMGIIGSNGAGKTTLLKVLSRITEPTTGRAEIHGRLISLLEVGTGFHQELTGRENVYLNGTILGMSRKEIARKFAQIVEFAGLEKFIDTPVKRYSSGMRVRLAFSVAAHLEPEILLVDEVLAVGDAAFQKKCLGKMDEVAKAGRTVLFVSHNMGAIAELCEQVIWLERGQVKLTGCPRDIISSYLLSETETSSTWINDSTRSKGLEARVKSVRVLSAENLPADSVDFDTECKVEIAYEVVERIRNLSIMCRLTDSQGNLLWTSRDIDTTQWGGRTREPGQYLSICQIPGGLFRPGRYLLSVGAFVRGVKFIGWYDNVVAFNISPVGCPLDSRKGLITPVLKWEVKRVELKSRAVQN